MHDAPARVDRERRGPQVSPCCLPAGYVSPGKQAALRLLAAAGVSIPDGGQIWGARDGLAWRLVDRRGQDPVDGPVGSMHPLRSLLDVGSGGVEVVDSGRGRMLRIK